MYIIIYFFSSGSGSLIGGTKKHFAKWAFYISISEWLNRNSGAPTMARSQASRIKWGNHRNRFQKKSTEIRDVTDSLIFTFEVVAQKCNFRNFTKKCDIQWIGLGKSHDPILDKPWVMIQGNRDG